MQVKHLIILLVSMTLNACAAVSFTHATGASGQAVTNAEVQTDNTVVLTYPNGSACIDTNPGASQTCKSGGP